MSNFAKSLLEDKLGLWEQVKGINERATAEKRGLNPDEVTTRGRLMEQIDALDVRTKDILADEQRMADATTQYNQFNSRVPEAGTGQVEKRFNEEVRKVWRKESDGFDIPHANSAILKKMSYGRPLSPTETRTLTDSYLAPGSFTNQTNAGIVPIDFYDQLISYLVEVSGVMQTGPTVLHTQGGEPIQMPIVAQHTGQVTAGGVGKNGNLYANLSAQQAQAFNQADPIFSQKVLSANKFGILIQVPRELLDDSGVNLLGYLATSAGRSLGNNIGNALINGGGGISGPLLGASGVNVAVTGTNGVSGLSGVNGVVEGGPSYANLVNLQYSVIAPYRQSRSCYWLAADQSLGNLRLLTDNVGRPIWEPSTVLGTPDLLLGKPIVADPFMNAFGPAAGTTVVFGDFSQFVIRMIGDMRFERSDDFAFNTDLVAFRAVLRLDSQTLNVPAAQFPRSQPWAGFQSGT